MPTAASAYRKKRGASSSSSGRGSDSYMNVDPRDIIPNLHKQHNKAASSSANSSNKSSRKFPPFLRKNSGGLVVGGLLAVSGTASGTYHRRGSGDHLVPISHPSTRRGSSFLLEEETQEETTTNNKLFFGESFHRLLNTASTKAKTTASALTSLPSEKGAAFIASHRSRRGNTADDRSVHSKSKSLHGGRISRATFGLDMKRTASILQKSSQLKRSFQGGTTTSTTTSALNSMTDEEATSRTAFASPLVNFFHSFHHSYIEQLSSETPTNLEKSLAFSAKLGNRHPGRPVYNGHYVRVRPTPIKNPRLVIYSSEMCKELGLLKDKDEECSIEDSEVFLKYFSGDLDGAASLLPGNGMLEDGGVMVESWATPYALSIMGRRYTNNVSVSLFVCGERFILTALSLADVIFCSTPFTYSAPTEQETDTATDEPCYAVPFENFWRRRRCIILVFPQLVP
jgi:hypothetical protein